ncbi:MAG: tRNA (N6-threonylcarbamoyladenosine(37)-N6)-methyltransferase TrmO [Methanobrevibacter sp.]|jgi:tRNA-Thr(GGU) m(6)t(6)A37 methyltransferase TsaA|nr:tRNA (N6-threonylcarbamoyladenosine(37)-N6)-methyltransferase TrmO [Methanobrevibacter sp.]
MPKIEFNSIGMIYSPFKNLKGMPIQPIGGEGVKGEIHINEGLKNGLKDLNGFSHLILIYYLHKSKGFSLEVTPFLDNNTHGVFATRSPKRPNSVGLSIVKLDSIEDNILYISNMDILDETPLLDIKPYVPQLNGIKNDSIKIGWFEEKHFSAKDKLSDARFI